MNSNQPPQFDSIKQLNPYSVEYWSARDLMPLLGYGKKWQNFESVIKKAITACAESGNTIEHHFTDASKPITTGKGAIQKRWEIFSVLSAALNTIINGVRPTPQQQENGIEDQRDEGEGDGWNAVIDEDAANCHGDRPCKQPR